MTQEKRYQIYALKGAGQTQVEIARQIEVHPATVSRELKVNRGQRGYRPQQAQRKAGERQKERAQKERISTITEATWRLIEEKLRLDWSPEQVSGWLARQKMAGLAAQTVSHERIYLHIYADKKLGGTLHEHLRCQKKRRKRYGSGRSGRSGRSEIVGRVPIEERPAIVEERTRVGDWELDSIIGKGHQGALVSLVDRTSRLTLLQKVDARTAELVAAALTQQLEGKRVLTLTSDNGKEFAYHQQVSLAVGAEFFFANPYCSWERGTNENTNGLVRQYLPKASTLPH